MPRKFQYSLLPTHDVAALARALEPLINRLSVDSSDYNYDPYYFGDMASGATIIVANLLLKPSRNRHYLRMQACGNALSIGSALDIVLYAGGKTSTDKVFEIVLSAEAPGFISASTSSVLNAGKDSLDVSTGWSLDLTASVAGWEDCTVELVYEDFVPSADYAV